MKRFPTVVVPIPTPAVPPAVASVELPVTLKVAISRFPVPVAFVNVMPEELAVPVITTEAA